MDHSGTNKGKTIAPPKLIVVRTYICGMYPFAKPPIGLILHTCICIHISITPQKKGFELWISMTCPTGCQPQTLMHGKNNYGKTNYGKTGQSALAPWCSSTGKINVMEIMATSKNYGKKRFGSLPGYFEPLWGKTQWWKNRTQAPPV